MGTSPDLCRLGCPLTPLRSRQLRRIKKFFKVQTVKCYTSSGGKKKCVGAQTVCQEQPIVRIVMFAFHRFSGLLIAPCD